MNDWTKFGICIALTIVATVTSFNTDGSVAAGATLLSVAGFVLSFFLLRNAL